MNKAELIAKAANDAKMTKKSVALALDALMNAAQSVLAEGEEIHISGFGVFSVKKKDAYLARNPKTNEPVQMPETKRITFTASKVLKEKIQ